MSEYSRSVLVFFCVCVFFHFLSLCIPSLSLRLSLSLSRSLSPCFYSLRLSPPFVANETHSKQKRNAKQQKKTKKTQKFSQSAVVWIEMCRQRLDAFFLAAVFCFSVLFHSFDWCRVLVAPSTQRRGRREGSKKRTRVRKFFTKRFSGGCQGGFQGCPTFTFFVKCWERGRKNPKIEPPRPSSLIGGR